MTESELNWTEFWFSACEFFARKSKDTSTKIGVVIVGEGQTLLSQGWNGFPRGVNDKVSCRHDRPEKYKWTEHAERNAIYNAAREGIRLKGSTIYAPLFACPDCSRAIVQAGIKRIVCRPYQSDPKKLGEQKENRPQWLKDFEISKIIFEEGGVEIIEVPE